MAWWIEMAQLCYPSAEVITYLYPDAIAEAADLGSPIEKSTIVPNGMQVERVRRALTSTLPGALARSTDGQETKTMETGLYRPCRTHQRPRRPISDDRHARVQRGIDNFHLDVLGPTDHVPDYYQSCREKARELALEDQVTFQGTVPVRESPG